MNDQPDGALQLRGAQSTNQDLSTVASAAAREQAEIQAAMVMAKQYPRHEQDCYNRVCEALKRERFADAATYSFPRGQREDSRPNVIEGPSVKLAREAVRVWGNSRSGYQIVDVNHQFFRVRGFCYDLETNALKVVEFTQRNTIYRKKSSRDYPQVPAGGGWVTPNDRDGREMQAKAGAIAERNAILESMPPDAVEDWVAKAKETEQKAAGGKLQQDRSSFTKRLASDFFELHVTQEMLEAYIQCKLDVMTREHAVELQGIRNSLRDGNTTREDHFDVPKPTKQEEPAGPASTLDKLAAAAPAAEPAKKATVGGKKGQGSLGVDPPPAQGPNPYNE